MPRFLCFVMGAALLAGCDLGNHAVPGKHDSGQSSGTGDGGTGGEPGRDAGSGGAWDSGQPPIINGEVQLTGIIRDFHAQNPIDFENPAFMNAGEMPDFGFVEPTLGADQTPVYAGPAGGTLTTSGPESFAKWFHDVPGVNTRAEHTITLKQSPGTNIFTYSNQEFFPIDGEAFGNEGYPHNFHFTYEIHTVFTYKGGETFSFDGDDDLWVFINGKLVIDLGGIHSALQRTVVLDDVAASVGIQKNNRYPLDLFFAERHAYGSHFRIDTSIADLSSNIN